MFGQHHIPMAIAYVVALGGWLVVHRIRPEVWPAGSPPRFERPWREFGFALVGAVGVLGVGQLWIRGIRLPERGDFGPVLASINQVAIFAPILLVVAARRHPPTTAWLPRGNLGRRLAAGFALATVAVVVYSLTRAEASAAWTMLGRIWRYEHLDELTQVLLEDVAVAILFVRLAAAMGPRWATAVVAALFAVGHLPVMLVEGASTAELALLLRDMGLGVAVILVLQRSRDVLWFWLIHFSMDMSQFGRINGIG